MSDLIKREDAINAVEMFFKDAYIEDSDVHCTDMEYEINHIPTASPWRRAEDELPPKATWVLTVAMDGNVKLFNIATVDAGGQWWTCSPQNILMELYGVRYWMPIEPPKEDA